MHERSDWMVRRGSSERRDESDVWVGGALVCGAGPEQFSVRIANLALTADDLIPRPRNMGTPTTHAVWDDITPIQPDRPGIELPRSFRRETSMGEFWVLGNVPEHVEEMAGGLRARGAPPAATDIDVQAEWHSMQGAIEAATGGGNPMRGRAEVRAGWELRFGASREAWGPSREVAR